MFGRKFLYWPRWGIYYAAPSDGRWMWWEWAYWELQDVLVPSPTGMHTVRRKIFVADR